MKEVALKKDLVELAETMAAMASAGAMNLQAAETHMPGRPPQEAPLEGWVDHLRLQVKYVLFDLEATRRENHYLRQMLDNRRGNVGEDGDDRWKRK